MDRCHSYQDKRGRDRVLEPAFINGGKRKGGGRGGEGKKGRGQGRGQGMEGNCMLCQLSVNHTDNIHTTCTNVCMFCILVSATN